MGGLTFAVASYFLGTVIYELEGYLWSNQSTLGNFDLVGSLLQVFQIHLFTLAPWVIATSALSAFVGYIFDKQVKYRRKAEELQARAEALSVTDGLTLLYNHRYFIKQLAQEIKRTRRMSSAFSLLFLDIDNFKQYNDTRGHLAGDDVLRSVAMVTKAAVRETDVVARYGGEEIVVVAFGTPKAQGARLAEKLRTRIGRGCAVTVSIGVASFPDDGITIDELIDAADHAMYWAKRHGKDQVCLASKEESVDEEATASCQP